MSQLPPMLPPISDEDASPQVAAVYADIRETRGTDFINAFWRVLAHDPALLKRTWEDVKAVMAPGALDPLTKELVYIAVSITNGCTYCINSHTAAARAKGMTDAQLMELVGVVGMANETNRLVTGLQVPVDDVFLAGRAGAPAAVEQPAPARRGNGDALPAAPAPAKRKAAKQEAEKPAGRSRPAGAAAGKGGKAGSAPRAGRRKAKDAGA